MTLPSQFNFPQLPSQDEPEKLYQYLKEQRFELTQMYEQMVFNINGSFRSYADTGGDNWTPTLSGSSTTGSFEPYTTQVGWSIRSGIITELWFDIVWTTTTATGTLQLDLPYKVALSDGSPFIGIAYNGSVLTISANPDTYTATFQGLAVTSSGSISGHICYIGVDDE